MDDNTIIALYFERNEEAVLETRKKYSGYLYTIAHNILQNKEDAEECENDTYLAAWNAMPPARPKILSAFLAKITRNLSLAKHRHQSAAKRGSGSPLLSLDELTDSIPDSSAWDSIEPSQLAEVLNTFLKTLATDERRVFLCRYWYCDPISDIAGRFGFSISKVKMMLLRSRKKLLKHLKKEGFLV